jgi:hypothetical protein
MKTYRGYRGDDGLKHVEVLTPLVPEMSPSVRPLVPRYDLFSFAITFDWGKDGNRGASQLAVALLADAIDASVARGKWHVFVHDVVWKLPDEWTLKEEEILAWRYPQATPIPPDPPPSPNAAALRDSIAAETALWLAVRILDWIEPNGFTPRIKAAADELRALARDMAEHNDRMESN